MVVDKRCLISVASLAVVHWRLFIDGAKMTVLD